VRYKLSPYIAAVGDDAAAPPDELRELLLKHTQALERIEADAKEQLLFRKIATVAAVAGAAFALLRLTDIYLAFEERKERRTRSSG